MRTTRTSTLLLASAMLITLSVTAGCGTATGERAAASSENEFAAIEAQANAIYTKIGGDAREREAAHYLVACRF
jgi:hypothetical protein